MPSTQPPSRRDRSVFDAGERAVVQQVLDSPRSTDARRIARALETDLDNLSRAGRLRERYQAAHT